MKRFTVLLMVIIVALFLSVSQANSKNTNGKILVRYSPDGKKINDLRWETDSNYSAFLPLSIDHLGQVIVSVGNFLLVFDSAMETVRKGDYCAQRLLIDNNNNYLLQVADGIFKTDVEFNEIWKIENIHLDLYTEPITLDHNNNFYYINSTCTPLKESATLVKYDEAGNFLWHISHDDEEINPCVMQDILIYDEFIYWRADAPSNLNYNTVVYKYGNDASSYWHIEMEHAYNLMRWNEVNKNLVFASKDYLTFYSSEGELLDEYSIDEIVDASGSAVWVSDLEIDTDGQFSILIVDRGDTEKIILEKINQLGEPLWSAPFVYSDNYLIDFQTQIDSENNILISGLSCFDVNDCNCVLFKLDSNGNHLWENRLPRCYSKEFTCSTALDEDDNIYLAGYYGYEEDDGNDDDDEPGCGCF